MTVTYLSLLALLGTCAWLVRADRRRTQRQVWHHLRNANAFEEYVSDNPFLPHRAVVAGLRLANAERRRAVELRRPA